MSTPPPESRAETEQVSADDDTSSV